MTDHWERKVAQATANSLIDALVPTVIKSDLKNDQPLI